MCTRSGAPRKERLPSWRRLAAQRGAAGYFRGDGVSPSKEAEARILIADDHPLTREGLARMLIAAGFAVVGEAETGADTVRLAHELKPDVIMMDTHMPDTDGIDATRTIKEQLPRTSVIIFSGYQDKDDLRRAVVAGASGYLSKTATKENLARSIRVVLNGGSLIDTAALHDLLLEIRGGSREANTPKGLLGSLSPRENEALQLLVDGMTNKEIARAMHYSVGTVKNLVQHIIEKLGVSDRTQAAVLATRATMGQEEPPRTTLRHFG